MRTFSVLCIMLACTVNFLLFSQTIQNNSARGREFGASRAGGGSDIHVYLQEEAIIAGENFFVYVEVPEDYTSTLRFGQIPNPSSAGRAPLSYWAGPSIIRQSPNVERGRVQYRFVYRANSAGWSQLDPFSISIENRNTENRSIESDILLVPVTTNGSFVPPLIEWRVQEPEIYLGQSTLITLYMYQSSQIVFPQTVETPEIQGGLLEEVTGMGEIIPYEFLSMEFSRVPIAVFLYTAQTTGSVTVPRARAEFAVPPLAGRETRNAEGAEARNSRDGAEAAAPAPPAEAEIFVREAEPQSIAVRALPQSISSSAVGNFSFHISELPSSYAQQELITLELTVRGEGNHNILQFPELQLVGGIVEEEKTLQNISVVEAGYAGVSRQIFTIRTSDSAELRIDIAPFAWFDPGTRRTRRTAASQYRVELLPPLDSRNFLDRLKSLPARPQNPVFFSQRYNIYDSLARAQSEYEADNLPSALAHMRRIAAIAPFNADMRALLGQLEEEMKLTNQHQILKLPHGDWLILLALFLTVCLVVLVVKGRFGFVCACFSSLIAISALLLGIYYYELENPKAIIAEGGVYLQKIPDTEASDWLYLPEGTSVQTGARSRQYIQIQSANGIVAWLEAEDILEP